MPCTDGGPIRSVSDYEYNRVKQRLDKVTRLLCTVMSQWEEDNLPVYPQDTEGIVFPPELSNKIKDNKELQDWWTEHQKSDREREKAEKEALVASAKSKLTKKELKAILDVNK